MKRISEIPESERPREKLKFRGVQTLSDLELMAVLLRTGSRKTDVMDLSGKVIKVIDQNKGNPELDKMLAIDGIGPAKATAVSAALEFARRRIRPEGIRVTFPLDVLPLIQFYADRKQEYFVCVSLNGACEIIASRVVTIGLVDRTQVHPREVFADPVTDRASAVIIAHNHPIGPLVPSEEDREITKRIRDAGETLGIRLLDHIIFNRKGYYSFMESEEMDKL